MFFWQYLAARTVIHVIKQPSTHATRTACRVIYSIFLTPIMLWLLWLEGMKPVTIAFVLGIGAVIWIFWKTAQLDKAAIQNSKPQSTGKAAEQSQRDRDYNAKMLAKHHAKYGNPIKPQNNNPHKPDYY